MFSGLYLNEILCRLLHNHEEHKELYKNYQDTLVALQGNTKMELVLRKFELNLLAELGYAINLEEDCQSHQPIDAYCYYRFTPDVGFELTEKIEDGGENPRVFRGIDLISLRNLEWDEKSSEKAAKRLLRLALATHLGEKPLNSRSLFTSHR